jgi:hypothetical protein
MGYLECFWDKVEVRGPDECWPWKRAKNKQGYGQVTINRKQQPAHRVAWELSTGQEMPTDLLALHSCDWKPCCNPGHVRPGTGKDNAADEFTPENTYWNEKAQQRYCRKCLAINAQKTYQRRKAVAA